MLLLLLHLCSECTVYKKAEYSNTAKMISENPVKLSSIVLKNNDTIVINRSVALVEVNKFFIMIRYFSGDTLMVPSSEIRSVIVRHVNKSGTVVVSSILVIGGLAFTLLVLYGLYYLIYVLLSGGH
jgi:hypothetical protein